MEGRSHESLDPKKTLEKQVNSWVARIRTSNLPENFKIDAETILDNITKNEDVADPKEILASYEMLGSLVEKLEFEEEIDEFNKILNSINIYIESLRAKEN